MSVYGTKTLGVIVSENRFRFEMESIKEMPRDRIYFLEFDMRRNRFLHESEWKLIDRVKGMSP